jgi:predicted HTH domain antitoxin
MVKTEEFRSIAAEIRIFPDIDQKENFLFVVGALFARLISLRKAAEIMDMDPDMFLKLLDLMGLEFSYLSEEDIAIERAW